MGSDLKLTTFEKTMFRIITLGTDHPTETLSDVVSFLNENTATSFREKHTTRNEILTALANYVATTRDIHSKVQSTIMDRLKSVNADDNTRADIWQQLTDGSLDFQQFHVPSVHTGDYTKFPRSIVGNYYFRQKNNDVFLVHEDTTASGEIVLENLATLEHELYTGSYDAFFNGTYIPLSVIDTSVIEAVGAKYPDSLEGGIRTDIRTGLLTICDGKMILFSKTHAISHIRAWMSKLIDPDIQRGDYMYLNIGKFRNIFPTEIPCQAFSKKNKLFQCHFSYTLAE